MTHSSITSDHISRTKSAEHKFNMNTAMSSCRLLIAEFILNLCLARPSEFKSATQRLLPHLALEGACTTNTEDKFLESRALCTPRQGKPVLFPIQMQLVKTKRTDMSEEKRFQYRLLIPYALQRVLNARTRLLHSGLLASFFASAADVHVRYLPLADATCLLLARRALCGGRDGEVNVVQHHHQVVVIRGGSRAAVRSRSTRLFE
jgi:hypothetical protein